MSKWLMIFPSVLAQMNHNQWQATSTFWVKLGEAWDNFLIRLRNYLCVAGKGEESKGTHPIIQTLLWRRNGRDGVLIHQPLDCLLNHLFRRRSNKTSKFRVTGLCAENSPVTGEYPAQMASNAENISIWWHRHDMIISTYTTKEYHRAPTWLLYISVIVKSHRQNDIFIKTTWTAFPGVIWYSNPHFCYLCLDRCITHENITRHDYVARQSFTLSHKRIYITSDETITFAIKNRKAK